MANNNAPISEEIVAAISAAVEMMTGKKLWLFVLNAAMLGQWPADATTPNCFSVINNQ